MEFFMRSSLAFAFSIAASSASAQAALPCDWQASAAAIVEPWEENTRVFSNGNVRVALLDSIEPAVASFYLLVLHPPFNEVGGRSCTVIGLDSGLGYSGIFFQDLEASYDPARGLTLTFPAIIYLPEQSFQNSTLVSATINQSTGDVTVTQELGNE